MMRRLRRRPAVVWAAGLIAALLALGSLILIRVRSSTGLVHGVTAVAQSSGVGSVLLFGLIQTAVAASGVLPAGLVGMIAGGAYGVVDGFLVAASSTMAGAVLSFWMARSFLRGFAERHLARHARIANLDGLLKGEGWRMVCLLRLSPVMPFAATSYAFGLSSVGWRDYLLGTSAALPALFGYVLLGSVARQTWSVGSTGAGVVRLALLVLGAGATLILTWRIGVLARRAGFLVAAAPSVETGSREA